jgi:hypothetical protein
LETAQDIAFLLSIFSVLLIYICAVLITRKNWISLLVTIIFAFASPHFSTHYNALWSHNLQFIYILSALIIILSLRGTLLGLSAIPLAFAYITRPDSIVIILVFGIWIMRKSFKSFILFSVLGGTVALLFMTYSWSLYGTLLPEYYAGSRLSAESFSHAIVGLLCSPNRGLFVAFPLSIFSFYTIFSLRNTSTYNKSTYIAFSIISIVYWILVAFFPRWWGGFSYGPRLLITTIPFMTLLLIPFLENIEQIHNSKKQFIILLFIICIGWGGFFQYRGVSTNDVYEWNAVPNIDLNLSKIWSWKSMQVLHGIQ